MTNKFCAFIDQQAIKEILQTAFDLKDCDFEKIVEIYKVFKSNYEDINSDKKEEFIEKCNFQPLTSDVSFLKIFQERSTNVGVDLPVLISPDKYSKTVFIVAEDPLRNRSNENVVLGTPFAIHFKKIPEYSNVINFLLSEGYRVYLTDYYKLWLKKDKGKRKEKLPKDLQERFEECLQKEIEYLKPEFIITYGNSARNIIQQSKLKTPHISFPHPSGRANGQWEKILNENSSEVKRCTAGNKSDYIRLRIVENIKSLSN